MIQITDDRGRHTAFALAEPELDSIALTEGRHGTAWQRLSDGSWRSTTGATATWDHILSRRNVFLVYSAEPRG